MPDGDGLILRVEDVVKDFRGLRALDGVTFDVGTGEVKGVIGPNGSGKTTLFNVISGVHRLTAGRVVFDGTRIDGMRPWEIARQGLGRTFQIVRPFRTLTARENVVAALGHDLYGGALRPFLTAPRGEQAEEAARLLALVGLEGHEDTPAGDLPLVFQRRLEVARTLALRPHLIMLDEPMAGLTAEEIEGLVDLVRQLNDQGVTVLLIEHNVRVATELSDTIVVLSHGAKIFEGTPDEVTEDPHVQEAYLGHRREGSRA